MWRLYRPTPPVSTLEFIFLLVAFYWCWTVVFIPYLAQASEMTDDDASRNRINTVQGFFLTFSGVAGALIPFLLVDQRTAGIRLAAARALRALDLEILAGAVAFLERNPDIAATPYGPVLTITAIITVATLPVGLILYAVLAPDRPHHGAGAAHVSFSSVFRNRVFHQLLGGNFLIQAGFFWSLGLMPFYVGFVLRAPGMVLLLFLLPQMIAILLTPIWPRLIDRVGRAKALAIVATVPMTGIAALAVVPAGYPWLTVGVFIFISLTFPAMIMLPYSVGADAAQYAAWKTGKNSMGIHMSAVSLGTKLSLVTTGAAMGLASLSGFNPSAQDNPAGALLALRLLASLVPAAMIGVGCLLLARFPISKRQQAAIRARLARRV
jgi:Na+/melibiose symporter-like transporter